MFPLQDVEQVLVDSDGAAKGVVLKDGTEIHSKVVLSNATPYVTFKNLTPQVMKTTCTAHVTVAPDNGIYSGLLFFIVGCPFSRVPQSCGSDRLHLTCYQDQW